MALPIKYTPLPSPAVATINYIDLAEGVTVFNGLTAEKSTGEQYLLTTASSLYSHLTAISGSLGTNATISGSFDTGILNRPMLLKGNAFVTLGWRVTNGSGSNNNFLFAELRKYDGSTYTKIAEVSGAITSSAAGTVRATVLQISNIPATLIKAGEQISVNVGICGADAGSSPVGRIGCDPQNRDGFGVGAGNYDTSKLTIGIPAKIT